ncbi:MAG: hypothetical protein AAF926_08560, partial [Pseudomonadota bacterium]
AFEYIQTLLSYSVAPFVVVYLGGIFWARATAPGALAALATGFASAAAIAVLGDGLDLFDLHYLHVPLPVTLISTAAFLIVSLKTDRPDPEARLLWAGRVADAGAAVGRGLDRWLSAALLAVTLLVLIAFW